VQTNSKHHEKVKGVLVSQCNGAEILFFMGYFHGILLLQISDFHGIFMVFEITDLEE